MNTHQSKRRMGRLRTTSSLVLVLILTSILTCQLVLAQDGTNSGQIHINEGTSFYAFGQLINNSTNTFTNDGAVIISNSLDFQNGEIDEEDPPNTGVVIFNDNATASNASDASHVDGLVRKIGNDTFTFPTGDGGQYGPAGISAPGAVGDQVDVRYWLSNPQADAGPALGTGLTAVSAIEYWNVAGTPTVDLTLHWDSGSNIGTLTADLTALRIAGWDGTQWVAVGNDATTGNTTAGTITANGVIPNDYQAYTFGANIVTNDTSLTKAFAPTAINANGTSTLTFTITENATDDGVNNAVSFVDTLTSGLVIAATPNVVDNCGGTATITANAGASTITVAGATLANGTASCTIAVDVTSATAGSYVNGAADMSGLSGTETSAMTNQTLVVNGPPVIAPNQSFNLAETAPNSTPVGTPAASDPESNPLQNWQITNDPTNTGGGGAFGINPATGEITVIDATKLPAGGTTVDLTLTVDDDQGNTSAAEIVRINITIDCGAGTLISGNADVVATNSGVNNPDNALGAPDDTNYATVANGDSFVLDLTDTIPGGETIDLILWKTAAAGAVNVSASPDNISFSVPGPPLAPINEDVYETVTYTIPAGGARYIRIERNAGTTRVDAIAYSFCQAPLGNDTSLTKAFAPTSIIENGTSTLTFTIAENATDDGVNNTASFVDTLRTDLVIASTPNVVDNCGSTATITANAGGSTITILGATLADGTASCTIAVDVTSATAGSYLNGAADMSGLNGTETSAMTNQTLAVNGPPVIDPNQSFNLADSAANSTSVGTLTATDPEGDALQNWQITNDPTNTGGGGAFGINPATGEITVIDASKLPAGGTTVDLTLTVDDDQGNTSQPEIVQINMFIDCGPGTLVSGNADVVTSNSGVANPDRAIGAPDDSHANVANGDSFVLDLTDTVPAGETIDLRLWKTSNAGEVDVSASLDNINYSVPGPPLAPVNEDVYETVTYTIPAGGARYIQIARAGGTTRVDAVTYSFCQAPPSTNVDLDVTVNTVGPVRQSEPVSFTVTITNVDPTPLTSLPVDVVFPDAYLDCTTASRTPDNVVDNQMSWADLLATAGNITLNQNQTISFEVNCTAGLDTTLLPNQQAELRAMAANANDADGISIFAPTGMMAGRQSVRMDRATGQVTLSWQTSDESQIVAFNIYRKLENEAQWHLLTNAPIVAQRASESAGNFYEFGDQLSEVNVASAYGDAHYRLGILLANGSERYMDLGNTAMTQGETIFLPFLAR
ncbi:MAG: hypothetical protein AAF702_16345 [Chloroflexota bacterium]